MSDKAALVREGHKQPGRQGLPTRKVDFFLLLLVLEVLLGQGIETGRHGELADQERTTSTQVVRAMDCNWQISSSFVPVRAGRLVRAKINLAVCVRGDAESSFARLLD